MDTARSTVLVILGSIRAKRICPDIAAWIADTGRHQLPQIDFQLVDIKDWPLPMDDEPHLPMTGQYKAESTKAWSCKIASADAFIFVTPQYNWGYPAPLKNAIDHLYKEWNGKPAIIVSYGGRGGDKCSAQLHEVLLGLHMIPVETMPMFKVPRPLIEANLGHIDPEMVFESTG